MTSFSHLNLELKFQLSPSVYFQMLTSGVLSAEGYFSHELSSAPSQ